MATKKKKTNQGKRFDPERARVFSHLHAVPHFALNRLKCAAPLETIPRLFVEIASNPRYQLHIFGNPFPREFHELGTNPLQNSESLERELLWTSLKVAFFTKEISHFIALEGDFRGALLSRNYQQGFEILTKIEQEFGISLWLIENRLVLLELASGIEAQKEYASKAGATENGLLNNLVQQFSGRIERGVSFDTWKSTTAQYEDDYEQQELPSWVRDYLRFKANPWASFSLDLNYSAVLRLESLWSIIDQYVALIRILLTLTARSPTRTEKPIGRCLNFLKHIDCPYIANLWRLAYWEALPNWSSNEATDQLLDLYTAGNYEDVVQFFETECVQRPTIDQIELLAKAYCHTGRAISALRERGGAFEMAASLADVYLKNTDTYKSAQQLLKFALDLSDSLWISPLLNIVRQEFDPKVAPSSFHFFSQLCSTPETPKQQFLLLQERKCLGGGATEALVVSDNSSLTHRLFVGLSALYGGANDSALNGLPIARRRLLKYRAIALEKLGAREQAESLYRELYESSDAISIQDGIAGLARCFMESGRIDSYLSLLVSQCLSNEYLRVKFDLHRLNVALTDKDTWDTVKSQVTLCIGADFIVRWEDKAATTRRNYAFEDFLEALNVNRPSELVSRLTEFSPEQAVYFLENVCVADTMDGYPKFASSEDVKKERIAVCQLLNEIDPQASSVYLDEIRQLTQELELTRHVREIDESRIFVDAEGIKRTMEKSLKEGFSRYKSLLATQPGPVSRKYINVSVDGINFQTPSDAKSHLLLSLFLAIRDQFVTSPEFGLDSYLSVRIRHGALSGQIRKALTVAELITKRDGISDKYLDNLAWEKRLSHLPPESVKSVMRSLATFSQRVDSLTEKLKSSFIQVKTEKKQNAEGMFDFLAYAEDVEGLQEQITPDTSYDAFLQLVFDYLWRRTEENLSDIRAYIGGELKGEFNDAFAQLRQSVSGVAHNEEVDELLANIAQAQTGLQYELDHIANWFRKAQGLSTADFQIALAVQVALSLIANIYPRHTLRTTIQNTLEGFLKRNTFSAFVDILYILLDNIVVHSHQKTPNVSLKIELSGSWLILEIENSVDAALAGTEHGIEEKNETLKSHLEGSPMEAVAREGGTGFHKISKIIRVDLESQCGLEARYVDRDRFKLTLKIHASEVLCDADPDSRG
jgi:hypothetical protein